MNKLKQITTKAKQLYKSGKFAKWTDAIKAAAASLPGAKKKIGYSKLRLKADKELTKEVKKEPKTLFPYTKKQILVKAGKRYFDEQNKNIHKISGVKKKAAPKKKAAAKNYHKDTKSHNVKISVMSGTNKFNLLVDRGINEFFVDKLKKLTEELAKAEKQNYLLSIEWKKMDKNFKERNIIFKKHWPKRISMLKKMITETKKHIK